MNQDDLLEYYQRELTYLRTMGRTFAHRYPKVAGRLELGAGESTDPHVERLLEAFAFLTARIQHQIDGEFPEISSALLGVLYPQLLNPIPSMGIAQVDVDPEQGQLTSGHLIPRQTPLFAQTPQGLLCRFQTCYPVTLWPVEITEAGFESTDRFESLDSVVDVATVLRLRVACRGDSFQKLGLDRLRFYLNAHWSVANVLYELLMSHVVQVVILPDTDDRPIPLPSTSVIPVGFDAESAVLPYPDHAHPGYRLLQEYFTFREKFLFFDLAHLNLNASKSSFDVLFLLDVQPRDRLAIDSRTFALGCTPIINLFRKTTEPIRLDHRTSDYRLIPDLRREQTTEIHSIIDVSASSNATADTTHFEPFFSFTHHLETTDHKAFWHARRQPATREDLPGTEMILSFLDLDFNPVLPPNQTVFAHTLCTNRQLATQLPEGALLEIEEVGPVWTISCIRKPTPQLDPPQRGAALWQLISQLSLNHLSLSEGRESLPALREILRLYCVAAPPAVHNQIMGIRDMSCRKVVRRLGKDAWRGFCRGTEITLTVDEAYFVGSSAFVFASVLNEFFALYASINSFTQLVLQGTQREGIWKRWPPMAGKQTIL